MIAKGRKYCGRYSLKINQLGLLYLFQFDFKLGFLLMILSLYLHLLRRELGILGRLLGLYLG